MKLSVIILSYNTRDLLRACLKSLQANPCSSGMEVLVVDNASLDGSPERVASEFTSVRLLEMGSNLGFAGGNNVGLREAAGEYRLLLNSDTEVQPGALDQLVGCLDRNPNAGACGARLVYPDGRLQPSGSSFITLTNLLWEQLFLDRLFPASPIFAEHFLTEWHYQARRKLDVLSGACLLMRASCLEQIGLLDPHYFMYCEDVDWCLRARQAGWDRIFVPEARVVHHQGASSRAHRPEMVKIYNESRCYYFLKFYGEEEARSARRVMTAGARLRQAAWGALAFRSRNAAEQAGNWGEIARKTAAIHIEALPKPGQGRELYRGRG